MHRPVSGGSARVFSAGDLRSALREIDAIAKGTRCPQFLFSLSFNPPETERVTVEDFEAAIDKAEEALGLTGQSRAVVFHEKEGRRHAHVVWSRIDVESMKEIKLSFFKRKLQAVSKDLFLEHGWRLPEGLRDTSKRNPLNFTLPEWQQAKRTKQDAKALKITFQECWALSDNRAAFERALEDQGFLLARGDRRGFVAVDFRGETYSLSRWTGVKVKDLKARLGDLDALPDVATVKDRIASRMTAKLQGFVHEIEEQAEARFRELLRKKQAVKDRQRAARKELQDLQAERAQQEAVIRAARFRKGVKGLWDWVSGKTRQIRKENEAEARDCAKRDSQEREAVIAAQLAERRVLQQDLRGQKRAMTREVEALRRDIAHYLGFGSPDRGGADADSHRGHGRSAAPTPQR